jgi:hypothetical protein
LFPNEAFEDLFTSRRGRPSIPGPVIASVLVLQTLHNLSDRETADAVRFDLRWKAACGFALDAPGFHPSVLTYWRRRLATSDRPDRIFDAVTQVIAQTGAVRGKGRRAVDSTILDDAVARQDTVTQLIAQVRRVARVVPDAGALVTVRCTRLAVLTGQGYDIPGTHKTRHRRQDGFKAHVVIEPDTGLATIAELTKAASPANSDAAVGARLALADPTIEASEYVEVLGDSAYGTGDMLAALDAAGHTPVIKPWPLRSPVEGGLRCGRDRIAGRDSDQEAVQVAGKRWILDLPTQVRDGLRRCEAVRSIGLDAREDLVR